MDDDKDKLDSHDEDKKDQDPHTEFRGQVREFASGSDDSETGDEAALELADDVAEFFNRNIMKLKGDLETAKAESDSYLSKYKRLMADFDNFRKRNSKVKDEAYDDGVGQTLERIIPCMDEFEMALGAITDKDSPLFKGFELIFKKLAQTIQDMGVEQIPALGQGFDPLLHNAISHVKDPELGDNIIVDEIRKGYKYKDKILRASMVKVAN